MANENNELEKAMLNRLASLATPTWPFDNLPGKLNPASNQSFQTITHLPFSNEIMAIGDGATIKMAGIFQIDFFQAFNQPAAELLQRVDSVSAAFWAARRSIDLPAGPFIVRFPRQPSLSIGQESATHRTRALDVYYTMRAGQ